MFFIDQQSRIPVFEQIVRQAESLVLAGVLKPEDKLPSIRELTSALGINPNTIQKAYTELDRRGIIVSSSGRGCYVSKNVMQVLKARAEEKLPEFKASAIGLLRAGIGVQTLIDVINAASNEK